MSPTFKNLLDALVSVTDAAGKAAKELPNGITPVIVDLAKAIETDSLEAAQEALTGLENVIANDVEPELKSAIARVKSALDAVKNPSVKPFDVVGPGPSGPQTGP